MPGLLKTWPAWPEFTEPTDVYSKDPQFLQVKQEIVDQYGEESLRTSWLKVCQQLETVTESISSLGSDSIPSFNASHIIDDGLTREETEQIKNTGCFIVRGVVPEEEVKKQYQILTKYVAENRDHVGGWPAESPSMLRLYDSPAQIAIRSHPNHLKVQRKLNELWHDASGETSPDPLLYSDGIRDRPPNSPFMGLGPHIDAGSFSRWADPTYRDAYHHIFSGKPELHDCYDLNARKDANQRLFPATAHSCVFRAFQGWTALTPAAPRAGSLMLYPHVKAVVAYMLLRPFFSPPNDSKDIMDASKWTFNSQNGWFPGTMKTQSQLLSRTSHPHLRFEECLVHAPPMRPGDTIWWHTDMVHAVDTEHLGPENAAVAFIAACPTTPTNTTYIKSQLESALAGKAPPDYMLNAGKLNETKFKGYTGFEALSDEAKRGFGFNLL